MTNDKKVVTRMAPSPTGRFHVGGVRTAFYNYAFARQQGGKFILRIEDTDTERNSQEFEDEIYQVFDWCGMEYDHVYRQSENLARHQELLRKLLDEDFAYEGEESKNGEGKVIRFKNPNKEITFEDKILGSVTFNTADLGDFVIARNNESPLYHLAVVIDDHDEGVTHVIRAQEHLANTPRQILIHEALGFEIPVYAHIPFILGPDGKKKLSKRDANVAVLEYQEMGYLPEALLNFLAFIGWNPGTDQEIFTKDELVTAFNLSQVQKGPAGYNLDKLNWINKQWLAKMSDEAFKKYCKDSGGSLFSQSEEIFTKILPIIKERIHNSEELREMVDRGEFDYFFQEPTLLDEPEKIIWKKGTQEATEKHLKELLTMLEDAEWTEEGIKSAVWSYAEENGKGDVLWPLRYALSGKEKSPDPFTLAFVLGKEAVSKRINSALKALTANS